MGKIRTWKEEDIETIVRLYKEGISMRNIGTKFSAKSTTIKKVLEQENINITRGKIQRNMNENYFESIDTEKKAYLLGFLFADGSVYYRKRNNTDEGVLSLEVKESDLSIITLLKEELDSEHKICFSTRGNSNTVSVKISSTKIVKDLESFGLMPNKTYLLEKVVPDKLNDNFKISFLRGLFDGDGSIYPIEDNRFGINFTGYSLSYVQDFQNEINNLIGKTNPSKISKKSAYQATWNGGKEVKKIVSILYKNSQVYLPRKYSLALRILGE
jgi:hypothetical protein